MMGIGADNCHSWPDVDESNLSLSRLFHCHVTNFSLRLYIILKYSPYYGRNIGPAKIGRCCPQIIDFNIFFKNAIDITTKTTPESSKKNNKQIF